MKQAIIFFLVCITLIGCTSIPVFYGIMYSNNKIEVQQSETTCYKA